MIAIYRKFKRWLREWWLCRTRQCDYYTDYLAYGPPDLVHEGYHAACRKAELHFKHCSYSGDGLCSVCSRWEKAVRA